MSSCVERERVEERGRMRERSTGGVGGWALPHASAEAAGVARMGERSKSIGKLKKEEAYASV